VNGRAAGKEPGAWVLTWRNVRHPRLGETGLWHGGAPAMCKGQQKTIALFRTALIGLRLCKRRGGAVEAALFSPGCARRANAATNHSAAIGCCKRRLIFLNGTRGRADAAMLFGGRLYSTPNLTPQRLSRAEMTAMAPPRHDLCDVIRCHPPLRRLACTG